LEDHLFTPSRCSQLCLLSYKSGEYSLKGGEHSFRGVIFLEGKSFNCFLYSYHVFLFGV
jgi:hypothetical protein